MPEITLASLDLSSLSASELEQKRREIVLTLRSKYPTYDDVVRLGDEEEVKLLQSLTAITSALRGKSSGPPKEPKKPRVKPTISLSDL